MSEQLPPPSDAPPPPVPASLPPPAVVAPAAGTVLVAEETAPGSSGGVVRLIGNILWLLLAGIWMAIAYVVVGDRPADHHHRDPVRHPVLQARRLCAVAFRPNRDRDPQPGHGLVVSRHAVWFFLSGLWLALGHVITGILLCITIIGIPFGIASFKLARLALFPFGKTVVRAGTPLPHGSRVLLIPVNKSRGACVLVCVRTNLPLRFCSSIAGRKDLGMDGAHHEATSFPTQ